jgi:hypothetical protein
MERTKRMLGSGVVAQSALQLNFLAVLDRPFENRNFSKVVKASVMHNLRIAAFFDEAVFFQFVDQSDARDAESTGGEGLVAAGFLEGS